MVLKGVNIGSLTSKKILPFSTPTVKIETERPKKDLHYGRPSQEMAKIDPVIEPRTQLGCGIFDEKSKISYVKNDSDEKSARLDPSPGQNSPNVLSQNPRGLGSTLQVRPECFSDIIAKQKQTSLVLLPNLGKVVLQSESSTSKGKKARRVVRRKVKKKEEDLVDVSQPSIKSFLSRKEKPSISVYGKRKSEHSSISENKKWRGGESD